MRFNKSQQNLILSEVNNNTLVWNVKREGSFAQVAARHGLSDRTVRRWFKRRNALGLSARPVQSAIVRRSGRPRKIPQAVETAVVAWVQDQVENKHQAIDNGKIETWLFTHYGLRFSQPYLSRMMRRNGFRSRRTQKRPQQRCRDTYHAEVAGV